jgi:hypothetical protein
LTDKENWEMKEKGGEERGTGERGIESESGDSSES